MAKMINTVTGPISTDALGRTLMHEHVFTLDSEVRTEYPWDEEVMVRRAVDQLKKLVEKGIDTMVDQTIWGLGRNVRRVRRISEESGLKIIAATGIFAFREFPGFFRVGNSIDPHFIRDFFVSEIENGIGDTGIKAAVMKIATEHDGISKEAETVIRAAAQAHRITGAPMTTHSHAGTRQGLEQQKILREEGVDLTRVLIGHSGDSTDLGYLEELMEAGSFIGMDRFYDYLCPFEQRIKTVAELCRRGYAGRMMLSQDANVESDSWSKERCTHIKGLEKWNHMLVLDEVIPALLEQGVSQSEIDIMMVENPRRFFENNGSY